MQRCRTLAAINFSSGEYSPDMHKLNTLSQDELAAALADVNEHVSFASS